MDDCPATTRPQMPGRGPDAAVRRSVRRLRPSLTDVFFAALIVWLFLADPQGWSILVRDGDVALHTRVGDYILDHGAVPVTDPFSFTRFGDRWFAFQWLSGILFALLNRWAGLKAIVLLCGAVAALTFSVLLRDMARRGANGLLALLLAFAATNASLIHLHARPHLFTTLFLAVSLFLIARDRENPTWRLWLLPPLMVLWVNLHSGFPVLLATLGILVVGTGVEAYRLRGAAALTRLYRYTAVFLGCAAATLVNPNGIALHLHVRSFLSNEWLMRNVNEYQSPQFRSEPNFYYMALLFAAIVILWPLASKQRWTEALWILTFAAMSLMSARHIPLFLVAAVPHIALAGTEAFERFAGAQPRQSTVAMLRDVSTGITGGIGPISVWTLAFVAVLAVAAPTASWPQDLSADHFPRDIVRVNRALLANGRVFTVDQWGDYLLWVNYPRQRVFIDGRSDFFSENVGREYLRVARAEPGWRDVLERYGVDVMLIPSGIALAELVAGDAEWRETARDPDAVIFVRAGGSVNGSTTAAP